MIVPMLTGLIMWCMFFTPMLVGLREAAMLYRLRDSGLLLRSYEAYGALAGVLAALMVGARHLSCYRAGRRWLRRNFQGGRGV